MQLLIFFIKNAKNIGMIIKQSIYILRMFVSGILIGIANLIPGISGGTIAVVTGIYDNLIKAISSFSSDFRQNLSILVPVITGTLSGIFLFSGIITFMLRNYPEQSNFMFTGLIAGSFPFILRKSGIKKISIKPVILFTAAFVFIIALSLIPMPETVKTEIMLTRTSALMIFLSGIIAAAAMIIPGISGSFILLLLGSYGTILDSINKFYIPYILIFFAGIITGLALTSKIINHMLCKYHALTYFAVAGLIAGSVAVVFPGFSFSQEGGISILCGITGYLASYISGKIKN